MSERRITITPKGVSFTVELPFDLAKAVLRTAPEFLKQLRAEIRFAEQQAARNKRLQAHWLPSEIDPLKQWGRLLRHTDRQIRQRWRTNQEPFAKVVGSVAREFDIAYSDLLALITVYRNKRKEKIRAWHKTKIIRYHLVGYSNFRIGQLLKPKQSAQYVARHLGKHPDLIASLAHLRSQIEGPKYQPPNEAEKLADSGITKTGDLRSDFYERQLAERKKLHAAYGVQIFREYRQSEVSTPTRRAFFQDAAARYDVPPNYAEHLYSRRRDCVQAYVLKRRKETIYRLSQAGNTYKDIAERVGLHPGTVARHFREMQRAKS